MGDAHSYKSVLKFEREVSGSIPCMSHFVINIFPNWLKEMATAGYHFTNNEVSPSDVAFQCDAA